MSTGLLGPAAPASTGQPSADAQVPDAPGADRATGHGPAGIRAQRVAIALAMAGLPLLRPGGPGNTGLVDVGLLVGLVAVAAWAIRSHHQVRFPYAVPVALSVLAGAVAAVSVHAGLRTGLTMGQDVYVLFWAWALAAVGHEPALLRTAARAWAISGALWALVLILAVLGHVDALAGITARDGSRASLTLGDPNLAADYFFVSLMVLRASRYPRSRWLRWLCCGLIITAMILTGSNGGMVTLLVATGLGAVLGLLRRRGMAPAVLLACVLVLVGATAASTVSLSAIALKAQDSAPILRDSIGRQAESDGSRSALAAEAVELWRTDGLLGIGPGLTKETLTARQAAYVKEAHDDYAATLVERGVLGALALVLLLAALGVRCRRIVIGKALVGHADAIPRAELLVAAVVGVLISASFYEVLHFRHVWALFGLVAAVADRGRE